METDASLSTGHPANLEECIAVGSINADRPHMYGVSTFARKSRLCMSSRQRGGRGGLA